MPAEMNVNGTSHPKLGRQTTVRAASMMYCTNFVGEILILGSRQETQLLIIANKSIRQQRRPSHDKRTGTSVLTRTKEKVERPPLYKVLILNDDYTPMEFVVVILQDVFAMKREQAISLMLDIHHQGVGVAGVFTHEIAETKASQVTSIARKYEHPLRCKIEKE